MSEFAASASPYFSNLSVWTKSSLLGIMINWGLLGVLWTQVYLYCVSFPKDRRLLKLIVFAQLLLETSQTVMLTNDIIQYFTLVYTSLDVLNYPGTSWLSIPLLIGTIASITQGFYCYRVGALTQSKCAVALISMLSFGQLAAAIVVTTQFKHAMLSTTLLSQSINLATIGIWAGCSFSCDITIAAIMAYYLKKQDRGFSKDAHYIIVRLIKLSFETGCITALSVGILLVLVYLPGHPPYYIAAASIVAKTYSNAMVAILNSRAKPVSNASEFGAPLWNESLLPIVPNHPTGLSHGLVFLRASKTSGFSSYNCVSSSAPA